MATKATREMPDIDSAKIIHVSELSTWKPTEEHGKSVRVLGRVKSVNAVTNILMIEYHGAQLAVDTELLANLEDLRIGMMCRFMGELEKYGEHFRLRARLWHNMNGLRTDLFDRALQIRRNFEKRVLAREETTTTDRHNVSSLPPTQS